MPNLFFVCQKLTYNFYILLVPPRVDSISLFNRNDLFLILLCFIQQFNRAMCFVYTSMIHPGYAHFCDGALNIPVMAGNGVREEYKKVKVLLFSKLLLASRHINVCFRDADLVRLEQSKNTSGLWISQKSETPTLEKK